MPQSQSPFVRHDQIPPAPPPASEAGAIKWVRDNLFSSWLNTLMTLIAAYLIARFVIGVLPWFYNGVWQASSIKECRDILSEAGKATGACFAVLVDRWDHLLFGFKYPQDAYWRPTLAFVLMLVAAAPVLFSRLLPRKMLILTGLYPFIGFWLIWGGSLWVPLGVLAALAATVAVVKAMETLNTNARTLLAGAVGLATAVGLAYLLYLGATELWFYLYLYRHGNAWHNVGKRDIQTAVGLHLYLLYPHGGCSSAMRSMMTLRAAV